MWKSSGGELYTFYKICPWTSSTWSLDRHKLHKHDKRPSCEFRTRCRMSRSNHIWNTMLQSQLTTSAFKANRESRKNEHGQLQEYCKVSVQTKQLNDMKLDTDYKNLQELDSCPRLRSDSWPQESTWDPKSSQRLTASRYFGQSSFKALCLTRFPVGMPMTTNNADFEPGCETSAHNPTIICCYPSSWPMKFCRESGT